MPIIKHRARKHIPISFSLALLGTVGLVACLALIIYISKLDEEDDVPSAVFNASRERQAPITSVIGTLATVSDASVTLTLSPVGNPYLTKATLVTVHLTPQTVFISSSVPSSIAASRADDFTSFYRFTTISRSSLVVGAEVNVRTGGDVRGNTDLRAESIEVITHR